jgi:hypothetical protein
MSASTQADFFLFEEPTESEVLNDGSRPMGAKKSSGISKSSKAFKLDNRRTANLQEIAKSLGVSNVKEPQPPATGGTWSDDSQLAAPHFRRDPDDHELAFYEEEAGG